MAYLALARKYRPKSFDQVKGQDHSVRALRNALDNNRLHHAYLFTGTRGVGKTTIARIFAACLNCEAKVSSDLCGDCLACNEIEKGSYPDLFEVDAASRTGVEDTRKLLENLHYAPSVGRFKVYIIDEVHMLSSSSFNALLKTLEEPPDYVKFIFATTDPKKIPLTVVSRCLQFHLRNIEPSTVQSQLKEVLGIEKVPFDEGAIELLSRAAQGSMRDALSLTDQAISHGGGSIEEFNVAQMLGTSRADEITTLLSLILENDRQKVIDFVADLTSRAISFADLLEGLQRAFHQLSLAQVTNSTLDDSLKEYIDRFSSEWLQVAYQILTLGARDLKYAPDHQVGFDMTILRLLDFEPVGKTEAIKPSENITLGTASPSSSGTSGADRNRKTSKSEIGLTEQTSSSPRAKATTSEVLSSPGIDDSTKELVYSHPIVKQVIEKFDARVVDVELH